MLFSDAVQLLNTSTILSFPFFRCTGLQFALKRFSVADKLIPASFACCTSIGSRVTLTVFFWRAAVACMCPPIKKHVSITRALSMRPFYPTSKFVCLRESLLRQFSRSDGLDRRGYVFPIMISNTRLFGRLAATLAALSMLCAVYTTPLSFRFSAF